MDFITKKTNRTVVSNGMLKLNKVDKRRKQQEVELWLLNSLVNANSGKYLNLESHYKSFAETPILCAYVDGKIGDGHNFDNTRNADGTVTPSFMSEKAERIVGYIKKADDVQIKTVENIDWIVAKGYIWTWYAKELIEKIKQQGLDGMDISIETLVYKYYMDGSIEMYEEYEVLGTTVLGVEPAVAGAHIRTLSDISKEEVRKLTLRVASAYSDVNQFAKKSNKGEKEQMSKILTLSEVAPKFGGYDVLKVCSETRTIVLMKKNEVYTYTFGEGEETVIPEKITRANATVTVSDGDIKVEDIELNSVVGTMSANLSATEKALEETTKEKATLAATVESMKNAEKTRRKEATKNAINEQLRKNKEAMNLDIAEDVCADILTDESLENYADMECNDEWVGETRAIADVDARCMSAIREAQSKIKVNSVKHYAWETDVAEEAEMDGVTSVINATYN